MAILIAGLYLSNYYNGLNINIPDDYGLSKNHYNTPTSLSDINPTPKPIKKESTMDIVNRRWDSIMSHAQETKRMFLEHN